MNAAGRGLANISNKNLRYKENKIKKKHVQMFAQCYLSSRDSNC